MSLTRVIKLPLNPNFNSEDLAWNVAADTDPLVQDVLNNTMAEELSEFQRKLFHSQQSTAYE